MSTIDASQLSEVTIDGQEVQEVTIDGDVVWTNLYTNADDFSTNTLSSYNFVNDWTEGGSWSYSYDSSNNWVELYTENNIGGYIENTGHKLPNTGIVRVKVKKINDYPNDNTDYIQVSNGDSYYRVKITGSNYDSEIIKQVNGTITDSSLISYSFDDESSFHTFEMHYSPERISLYVDGTHKASLDTTDTTDISPQYYRYRVGQFDGYLSQYDIDEIGTQVTNLNYEWYDTSTYYSNNDHPTSSSELDNFFDSSLSGVSFGGNGLHENEINWGDSGQTGGGGTVGSKPSYLPADGYSWKAEGYIYAPESGTYTFGVDSDDASDVIVNGTVTAYWYGGHGFEGSWTAGTGQNTGSVSLTGGNWYPFKARMSEGSGGDGIQVGWQKPSDSSINVIPYAYLTY